MGKTSGCTRNSISPAFVSERAVSYNKIDRLTMQRVCALALCFIAVGACQTVNRSIDGSSDVSFRATHDLLLESLSPEDQLRLTLAELIYLAPMSCAAQKEQLVDSVWIPKTLGGSPPLEACRRELDGKTFIDIMRLAYPPKNPGSGFASPPVTRARAVSANCAGADVCTVPPLTGQRAVNSSVTTAVLSR